MPPPPLMDKRENRQREPERVVARIAERVRKSVSTKRALTEREALFLDHVDVCVRRADARGVRSAP